MFITTKNNYILLVLINPQKQHNNKYKGYSTKFYICIINRLLGMQYNFDTFISSSQRDLNTKEIIIIIGKDTENRSVNIPKSDTSNFNSNVPISIFNNSSTISNSKMSLFMTMRIGEYTNIEKVLEGKLSTTFFCSDDDNDKTFSVKRNINKKKRHQTTEGDGSDIEKESSNESVKSKRESPKKEDIFVIYDNTKKSYLKSWKITRNHLEFLLYCVNNDFTSLEMLNNVKEGLCVNKNTIEITNYFGAFKFRIVKLRNISFKKDNEIETILKDIEIPGHIIYNKHERTVRITLKQNRNIVGIYCIIPPKKYALLLIDHMYFNK